MNFLVSCKDTFLDFYKAVFNSTTVKGLAALALIFIMALKVMMIVVLILIGTYLYAFLTALSVFITAPFVSKLVCKLIKGPLI